MRMTSFTKLAIFCVGAMLCAKIGSAQTCNVTGVTVGGSYIFSAMGNGLPGSLLSGTTTTSGTGGTTSSTSPYSNTELGQLLSGTAGTGPFASSGTVYLDGAGSILGTMTQNGSYTKVGTYVLNADCTITVTLTDVFATTPPAATTLQGVVLNNGAEIDLGVLQSVSSSSSTGTGTTGTTSTSGGLYESNVLVKLVRPLTATCNASDLSGPYVLIGIGTQVASVTTSGTGTGTTTTTPAQTEAPFFLFGLVQFDGNGNVIAPSGTPSTVGGNLRYTGSYTVNADCTGTMTLKAPAPSSGTTGTTSTTSSTSLSLSFILSQPSVAFNGGSSSNARSGSVGPGIQFSQSSATETLEGYGIAQ